ncbi:uncharacterized protein LOC118428405 isoform X2 [Branchiostoma floridae]|uniref:Uncharacterized protein LOC118428405 isoform X2 n=1 Tax=Branchiostoma floridae TaxID=7739 RepID=A0A9J7N927_BRAFL|nr:uncharacterized protein LOC118428405 isoform X2 [Branchiostoma floridae]
MSSRLCDLDWAYDDILGCRPCSDCIKYPDNPHCDDCLSSNGTTISPSMQLITQSQDTTSPLALEWQLIAIGLACGVVLVLAIAVFIRYTRRRDKTPRAMEHGISVDSLTGETIVVEESSAYTSSEMSSSGSNMADNTSILRETVI